MGGKHDRRKTIYKYISTGKTRYYFNLLENTFLCMEGGGIEDS